MVSVSGSQYAQFLIALRNVYQESNLPIADASEVSGYESTQGMAIASRLPPMKFEAINAGALKIGKRNLCAYEAAKRTGLNALAQEYLGSWQRRIQAAWSKKTGSQGTTQYPMIPLFQIPSSFTATQQVDLSSKVNRFASKITWPVFQNPAERQAELENGTQSIAIKQMIHNHFPNQANAIPDYAKAALFSSYLNAEQQWVVRQYSGLITNLSCTQEANYITDERVKSLLDRFPNLQVLDLTGCVKITAEAFQGRHSNLRRITITGTGVSQAEIQQRCPNAQIVQERMVKTFDLDAFYQTNLNWTELLAKAQAATNIVLFSTNITSLLPKEFNDDSLNAIEYLHNNPSKFNTHRSAVPGGPNAATSSLDLIKFSQVLFDTWKSCTFNWNTPMIGNRCLTWLMQLYTQQPFLLALFEDEIVGVRKENTQGRTTEYELQCTDAHLARIRRLLKTPPLLVLFLPNVFSRLQAKITSLRDKLFWKREASSFARDEDLTKLEALQEFYAAISQIKQGAKIDPFKEIQDPAKITRTTHPTTGNFSLIFIDMIMAATASTTHTAGPNYKEMVPQSLAAGFITKMNSADKNLFLDHVLTCFAEYKPVTQYYSLPRLVLGVMRPVDIPQRDQDSLLKTPLLSYQGVILDPEVSDPMKERCWGALYHGTLGGKTIDLIDALAEFCQKDQTTQAMKDNVKAILKELGGMKIGPLTGMHYHNPLEKNHARKAHAREVYSRLFPNE